MNMTYLHVAIDMGNQIGSERRPKKSIDTCANAMSPRFHHVLRDALVRVQLLDHFVQVSASLLHDHYVVDFVLPEELNNIRVLSHRLHKTRGRDQS